MSHVLLQQLYTSMFTDKQTASIFHCIVIKIYYAAIIIDASQLNESTVPVVCRITYIHTCYSRSCVPVLF